MYWLKLDIQHKKTFVKILKVSKELLSLKKNVFDTQQTTRTTKRRHVFVRRSDVDLNIDAIFERTVEIQENSIERIEHIVFMKLDVRNDDREFHA